MVCDLGIVVDLEDCYWGWVIVIWFDVIDLG